MIFVAFLRELGLMINPSVFLFDFESPIRVSTLKGAEIVFYWNYFA